MEKTLSLISRIPFFSGLPKNQLKEIKRIAINRVFNKGEAIFFEGDDGNGFFVVVDGLVKIFKLSTEGKEQILHIFGPGEPLGEVSVFRDSSFQQMRKQLPKATFCSFPDRHL